MLEGIYLFRVLIGGVLGLCVGLERSRRQKEAGMGTHFIVACASALLTCISLWFKEAGDLGDGARIAAQIVSGVGFLGAGLIFFRRESMRGLTTAAGIWATAAIGMCAATGLYLLAAGTTMAVIVIQLMNHTRLFKKNPAHLLIRWTHTEGMRDTLQRFFAFGNFHRFNITAHGEGDERSVQIEAVIHPTAHYTVEEITQFMRENPNILSIERLEDL